MRTDAVKKHKPKIVISYGLDLSLRHGAFVKGKWDLGGKLHNLRAYRILLQWDKPGGLNEKSDFPEIRVFCLQVYKELRRLKDAGKLPPGAVAVDWDPTTVFWGRRRAAVTLGFLAGYMARTLELLGLTVVFISPGELRRKLLQKHKAKKSIIWALFPALRKKAKKEGSDVKDSLVLSYMVARGWAENEPEEAS